MKKLIVFTLLSLGLNAQASVWECEAPSSKTRYLVAVDPKGPALIFEKDTASERASYSAIDGKVSQQTALDGGPTQVYVERTTEPVDWKKQKGCFVWQEPNLAFWLGRNTSEMRLMPNMVVKPKSHCSIPRVMAPRPIPVNCTKL